ncbi:MAG TPA: hypothetical protein PKJ47_05580 [Candidatus Limiplasma sp.]|nr:hypothetical protein [Candidatus Limiplasma sp.]
MKIDLTCPVELWQYTTPTDATPECTFMLNNLSDKVVISVQTTLICYGEGEKLLFRQVERVQGLNAGTGERFTITLLPSQWEGVKTSELVIEKVWFDDATVWRRGGAALTEYRPNALPAGRRLDQLRFVAGPDAVGYPQEQAHVWVCVCGRANDLHSDRCCRCERRRDSVFATCSRENVDQLIAVHEQKLRDVAKAAREDASRLAEEREKARLREIRKKKTSKVAGVAASGLALAIAALLLWGLPAIRYARATALLDSGSYTEARAALSQMGDYGDAKSLMLECDYRQAGVYAAEATQAGMQKAAELYAQLGDYQDSAALNQQTRYALGKLEMDAALYEQAADVFQALGDYQDSAALLTETQYLQAQKLYEGESYTAARILFSDLGNYRDAAQRALMCDYQLGKAAMDQNDLTTAIAMFDAAGDTEDAAQLYQQASYQLAEQKQQEGDYEAAGTLYQQAGEYQDAPLKANNSLYELARERMNAGDYAKAAELYQRIVPYLDSETLAWECVYRQAQALASSGEDEQAVALLVTIPKHTSAAELLEECRYRLAAKYADEGKTQEAIDQYQALGDYRDAATQLRKLRYTQAEAAFSAGEYENAIPLYQALGSYKDSADKLKQCLYAVAAAAMEAKDYQKAIESFTSLGAYKDSKKQLEAATYELALSLKTSGDADAAANLLKGLTDNTDAKNQLSEITMGEAAKAQAAGDLQKAATLYAALGDYGTAKENYQAVQYQLATQAMDSGDYRTAAALFGALGDYQDAAAKAEESNTQAYDRYAIPARAAYESGNWKTVADTLEGFDATNLPAAYRDLSGMYEEACYRYAEELYNAGKPYEALPYYQKIPNYRDVATKKLQRRSYLILGLWRNADGSREAEFRADGTCTLFGDELYFSVDGYGLKTGQTADTMTLTHKLTTLTEDSLSLRVLADGQNMVYQLNRVTPDATAAPAAPAATPAPTPTADTWEVSSAS